MHDDWRHVRSLPRQDYRIFHVREEVYTHPTLEGERSYFVIGAPDWVNVIALTADDQVVLIRQFRPGANAVCLEIPGGIVEPGEPPERTAARELLEETGFSGDPPRLLCSVEPNPALQDNRCHTYLVRNARPTAAPGGDPDERIEVVLRARTELAALVESGDLSHALVQVAVLRFLGDGSAGGGGS